MLNWDFVKADPITYRAIEGAIRLEVTVEKGQLQRHDHGHANGRR